MEFNFSALLIKNKKAVLAFIDKTNTMKKILFSNGDQLPNIGLGTWLSKKNEVYDAVLDAISLGYRHFDCAYIYKNEKEIGSAFEYAIRTGLVKREDLFITSKLWNSDHSPEQVEIAIRKSLRYLQLDYLDLYLIHWPIAFKTGHEQANDIFDLVSLEEIPLTSTWTAMEALQKKGLTKHIGVSNFNIPKLQLLLNNAQIKPEVNQIELHPYLQQTEIVNFCTQNGILLTAFSPLGSRHLIHSEAGLTREKLIISIAKKQECTPAQVLSAWGMQRGISVIPKSVNSVRIQENFGSLKVELDTDDMNQVASLERNLRMGKGAYCVFPDGFYSMKSIWED